MGMSFQEAIELYREVYHRFEKVEGKPWGVNGAMIELSKQVGDLSRCIMLKEEYYAYKGERPVGLEKTSETSWPISSDSSSVLRIVMALIWKRPMCRLERRKTVIWSRAGYKKDYV